MTSLTKTFDRTSPAPEGLTAREQLVWSWLFEEVRVRRAYIEKTNFEFEAPYCCPADLLVKHGEFWTPQPLPKCYGRGPIRQCFLNSGQLAFNSDKGTRKSRRPVEYAEGYALWQTIPIHHGFCVDDLGRVVDLTWRYDESEVSELVYFGVKFNARTWQTSRLMTGQLSLLDDWQHGFPALTIPYDGGEGEALIEAVKTGMVYRRDKALSNAERVRRQQEAF